MFYDWDQENDTSLEDNSNMGSNHHKWTTSVLIVDELDWGEAKSEHDSDTKSGLLLNFMDYDEDIWNACT